MNFLTFYGLAYNPFDKENVKEQDRFESADIVTMLNMLHYLIKTRGIGVFTARPGMGKTYGVRCFSKELNPNLYHTEYIKLTTVSVSEFYKQLCSILGLETKGGKPKMFEAIQNQIDYLYAEKRQPLILVIDEAQYLSTSILNDIKMLMNSEYDSVNKFTLILCAEPYFLNTLRKPVHEALKQRITVKYNFQGLSDEEVEKYVLHKIKCAGGAASIIDEASLSAVHSNSQGNPRIIDKLMTDALIIGAQKNKQTIDAEVIMDAVVNQNF